jgi:hypothetical protein
MEDETLLLDPHMDYSIVTGLSSEVRERLFAVRPTTIVRLNLKTTHPLHILILYHTGCCETYGRHDPDVGGVIAQACETDTSRTVPPGGIVPVRFG